MFPSATDKVNSSLLLSLSQFGDEAGRTSEDHYRFSGYVLKLLQKFFDKIVALIFNRCSMNTSFQIISFSVFVWFLIYRFNSAAQEFINKHNPTISTVHMVMKNLEFRPGNLSCERNRILRKSVANFNRLY